MHQPDIDGERLAIAINRLLEAIEFPKFNDRTLYGRDSAVNMCIQIKTIESAIKLYKGGDS